MHAASNCGPKQDCISGSRLTSLRLAVSGAGGCPSCPSGPPLNGRGSGASGGAREGRGGGRRQSSSRPLCLASTAAAAPSMGRPHPAPPGAAADAGRRASRGARTHGRADAAPGTHITVCISSLDGSKPLGRMARGHVYCCGATCAPPGASRDSCTTFSEGGMVWAAARERAVVHRPGPGAAGGDGLEPLAPSGGSGTRTALAFSSCGGLASIHYL